MCVCVEQYEEILPDYICQKIPCHETCATCIGRTYSINLLKQRYNG